MMDIKVTFLVLISPSGCGMGVEWVCLGRGPCVPDVHQKKLAPMRMNTIISCMYDLQMMYVQSLTQFG